MHSRESISKETDLVFADTIEMTSEAGHLDDKPPLVAGQHCYAATHCILRGVFKVYLL